MKPIKIENVKGQTEITVETGIIFKKRTIYRTTACLAGEFYSWVRLPHKMIVSDQMSFQLDEWKKSGI